PSAPSNVATTPPTDALPLPKSQTPAAPVEAITTAVQTTTEIGEETAIAAEATLNLAKVTGRASNVAMAVPVAINVALAAYHANEGKYFRAAMDLASISGVPFNSLPDLANSAVDASGQFFTFLALGQGAQAGVHSFWSGFVPRDASNF